MCIITKLINVWYWSFEFNRSGKLIGGWFDWKIACTYSWHPLRNIRYSTSNGPAFGNFSRNESIVSILVIIASTFTWIRSWSWLDITVWFCVSSHTIGLAFFRLARVGVHLPMIVSVAVLIFSCLIFSWLATLISKGKEKQKISHDSRHLVVISPYYKIIDYLLLMFNGINGNGCVSNSLEWICTIRFWLNAWRPFVWSECPLTLACASSESIFSCLIVVSGIAFEIGDATPFCRCIDRRFGGGSNRFFSSQSQHNFSTAPVVVSSTPSSFSSSKISGEKKYRWHDVHSIWPCNFNDFRVRKLNRPDGLLILFLLGFVRFFESLGIFVLYM